MTRRVELACTVCTEEFIVPIGVYRAHAGVVPCPCCGSTELILLGETGEHQDQPLPVIRADVA